MKLERHVCPHCRGQGETFVPAAGELRRRREARGVSRSELARRLGYSQSYLCLVELGKRAATPGILAGYETWT